ncbi:MAG: hypothetical protein R2941_12715 [Desulfobacterales bacterium]
MDKKNEAVAVYASQLKERPYGGSTSALNRYRSLTLTNAVTHAEGFFLPCKADSR